MESVTIERPSFEGRAADAVGVPDDADEPDLPAGVSWRIAAVPVFVAVFGLGLFAWATNGWDMVAPPVVEGGSKDEAQSARLAPAALALHSLLSSVGAETGDIEPGLYRVHATGTEWVLPGKYQTERRYSQRTQLDLIEVEGAPETLNSTRWYLPFAIQEEPWFWIDREALRMQLNAVSMSDVLSASAVSAELVVAPDGFATIEARDPQARDAALAQYTCNVTDTVTVWAALRSEEEVTRFRVSRELPQQELASMTLVFKDRAMESGARIARELSISAHGDDSLSLFVDVDSEGSVRIFLGKEGP